ncbi:hypothetical protein RhiirA5_441462 [Rhizophagus irregularis]|uniref:Uncharacterized protein n=1 Tax=Rhizophagus irregularis TaxID=588596 RepID=A0A2N0NFN7_9GLOM|nr:hypothetical protein RhiirA5_441462 [Rhizophagus irregularis]
MPLNKTNKRTRQIESEQTLKWTRGRPQELQVYLTKDCLNIDEETRREYIQKILQLYNNDDTEDNKRFQIEQLNITNFWDVDQNIVENPFFVDLIRKLQPGYKLPSHEKLAGIMLSHAVVRIEDQVNSILGKVTNLTLGLDGWTNLRLLV